MKRPDIATFLEKFTHFQGIPEETLQSLIDQLIYKEYKRKTHLYEPNQTANGMYFMWDGRVRICKYSDDGKEITKRIILPGWMFGELCILENGKRENFATAIHQSIAKVFFLPLEPLLELIQKDTQLLLVITKWIGEKLIRVEGRLEAITFQDAKTRIVQFIKLLADRYGDTVGKEIVIRTKLTHEDIAKLTATSRQTVTTIMNELKEENLIYFDRQRILIRNYTAL